MQTFSDAVVGEISVRRYQKSTALKFRLSPKGELIASAPPRMPLFVIKAAAKQSRKALFEMTQQYRSHRIYVNQQLIGKSHKLLIEQSKIINQIQVSTKNRIIDVRVPGFLEPSSTEVQRAVQTEVIKVLKKEAKAYLTRRLRILASRHDYSYQNIRFTHTGTRWGSCSSSGTISLNIALMMLPIELIDYVLIHELCHTREMNHSSSFWKLVADGDPEFKLHRRLLKNQTPLL